MMRFFTRQFCVMLCGVVFAALAFSFGAKAQEENLHGAVVEHLRIGQDQNRTRMVMEFAQEVKPYEAPFRWFTLPKPARVVLDFGDVSFKEPPNLLKLPETSLVKGMRAGRFRPGTVRMVIDLETPARVNVFAIPPGRDGRGLRLVVDVVPVKPGQQPTDVPPPLDVVDQNAAQQKAETAVSAPVVPRQVVKGVRDHVVVVLDPGHGGVDPGACGRVLRICEQHLTLKMAKLVAEKLQGDKIDVVLTRDSNIYVPLPERVVIAQKHKADLFVSLHADIHPRDRNVRGATVYMVSEKASDREAERLADSENAGDILAGVGLERENAEVRNILISLVQRETLNNSAYLGQSIVNEMSDVTEVRKRELLFAGFRVLKAPDVPSVLVEMGYLSNPVEERQMNDPRFRDKLAEAIAKGIRKYVGEHVHY